MNERVKGYLIRRQREKRVKDVFGKSNLNDITIFSQNCIGGVFYHDMQCRFLSPTINLYMKPSDFLKFVNNYSYYLSLTPEMKMQSCPVGVLDDIYLIFLHYSSCEEALLKWESRKKRINPEKIFVICCDRDGFSTENYADFKKLPYKKLLYTHRKEWGNDSDCLYLKKYKNCGEIPSEIIDNRDMYDSERLIRQVNQLNGMD